MPKPASLGLKGWIPVRLLRSSVFLARLKPVSARRLFPTKTQCKKQKTLAVWSGLISSRKSLRSKLTSGTPRPYSRPRLLCPVQILKLPRHRLSALKSLPWTSGRSFQSIASCSIMALMCISSPRLRQRTKSKRFSQMVCFSPMALVTQVQLAMRMRR